MVGLAELTGLGVVVEAEEANPETVVVVERGAGSVVIVVGEGTGFRLVAAVKGADPELAVVVEEAGLRAIAVEEGASLGVEVVVEEADCMVVAVEEGGGATVVVVAGEGGRLSAVLETLELDSADALVEEEIIDCVEVDAGVECACGDMEASIRGLRLIAAGGLDKLVPEGTGMMEVSESSGVV